MRADQRAASRDGPTLREGLAVLCIGFVLAILMHWPLILHLPTDLANDISDPMAQAWQLAWDGHAVRSLMFDPWQANIFWPNHDSLAFSDSLLGYAPFGVFASGPKGAIAQYNIVYLLAYALALAGPYVLARTLGLGRFGALIAGVAYAWAPSRWEQTIHLQVISSGTLALAVALLYWGYTRRDARHIYLGWIVVAWQLFVGPTLGVLLVYLLLALTIVAAVLWLRAGRPRPSSRLVVPTVVGLAIAVSSAVYVGVPYLRVRDAHPEARRTLKQVDFFSPPVKSFLAASEHNTVWGGITAPIRGQLHSSVEQTLFPGAAIVLLAAVGCSPLSPFSRRLRIGLLVMTLLCALFSLGLSVDHGRFTYRLLFDYAPGWNGSRTPGRINVLTTLSLALLAAAGAQGLVGAVRRFRLRRAGVAGRILGSVIVVAILLEGSSFRTGDSLAFPPHPSVPARPQALDAARGPTLELPSPGPEDKAYELWSTAGFPRLVNGASSLLPSNTVHIIQKSASFPDQRSIAFLRGQGIRTVVIHRDLAMGTPWEQGAVRSVAGLGITRRASGPTVVYDLGAPSR